MMPSPLNTFIVVDSLSIVINPSSIISKRSHVASFAAKVSAIYSASIDDNATVVCVDLRSSLSPAQSESEYPCIVRSPPPKVIQSNLPITIGFVHAGQSL